MGRDRLQRLGSVLVAHDGSPGAGRAARRATRLPLARGATVHVVHVAPPSADRGRVDAAAQALAERAAAARADLQRVGRPDVEVVHALVHGQRTQEELTRYARTQGAELLVLGRHGREERGEPSMGSTAFELLRHGDLPLLLAVHDAERPYERPVLAVDLTDASGQVVELALSLVPTPPPELELVHALHVPFQGTFSWALSKGAAEDMKHQARREAQARADRFVAELGPVPVSADVVTTEGEPSMEIIAQAAARAADLLVVGTHGRSGLAHAIFGSVAEWLVASSPCDVAVTRPARRTSDLK